MNNFKYIFLTIAFNTFLINSCNGQDSEKWTTEEKRYHRTLVDLAKYVSDHSRSEISKDTLFAKYIYFENVLNDTIETRKAQRLAVFDTIFSYIPKTIDSLGFENLDAKPLRFYETNEIYQPFIKSLTASRDKVLVYFIKGEPEKPLGTLLFEKNSGKLAAWLLLKQGDNAWFYLTFNLL